MFDLSGKNVEQLLSKQPTNKTYTGGLKVCLYSCKTNVNHSKLASLIWEKRMSLLENPGKLERERHVQPKDGFINGNSCLIYFDCK